MAYQRIRIKNTNVAGKVPGVDKLDTAELCINLKDQKLFSKDADGAVFEIGGASVGQGPTPPTNGNETGDLWWDGDFLLVWNGSDWEIVGGVTSVNGETGDVVLNLGDLNDVNLSLGVSNGDIIAWNGTAWVNTAVPPADISGSSINDLNDVDTTGADDGDILIWNQAAGEWQATDRDTVPENTSDLVNDGENGTDPFITEADVTNILAGNNLDGTPNPGANEYLQSGDNVSELVNDAGYITDAGVTKIVAGTNITIDPVAGTGEVTINASAGSGGGIEEAPTDGQIYGRKNASWAIIDIPEAADMEVTAELAVSGEQFFEVEWGETLRAIPNVIGGAQPVRVTYQWWNDFGTIVSDTEIPGATEPTYKVPEGKIGFAIWCRVTATDALGVEKEAETNRARIVGQTSPDLGDNTLGQIGDINLDGLGDDYILVWNEAESEWQVELKPDPGVTKIIAGDSIEVTPVDGTGEVTIDVAIDASSVVINLDDLNDVNVPAPASGDILAYDGAEWVSAAAPPADISGSSINQLNDVDAAGANDGDMLIWQTDNWVNVPAPTATSDFQNDGEGTGSPFITEAGVSNILNGNLPDGTPNPGADAYLKAGDDITLLNNNAVYLKTTETAADSNKLGGQDPSYYLNYQNLNNTPTIGDGALTIKLFGQAAATQVGTYTANQTSGTTITLPQIDYAQLLNKPTIPTVGDAAINVNAGNGLTATGTQATANQSTPTTRTLTAVADPGKGLTVTATGIGIAGSWANIPEL